MADEIFTWSWDSSDQKSGEWIPFDSRDNDRIERAFFNGDPSAQLSDEFPLPGYDNARVAVNCSTPSFSHPSSLVSSFFSSEDAFAHL